MITVAAVQFSMCSDAVRNVETAKKLISKAAKEGAQIILLPELFETPYFCKDKDPRYFELAHKDKGAAFLAPFITLAKALEVVLPVSYFEKAQQNYFNSLAMIDADGSVLGQYRKTHIPDGPGYEEKFYFTPGDTGFKVFQTAYGNVGVGICWDQWFCETARILTLKGADLILYPTAIGSEPEIGIDSKEHWQRVQMGHAAANTVPVAAANRIGLEKGDSCEITFYGSSFLSDATGKILSEASRDQQEIVYASYDFEANRIHREYWALLKDRRPQMYQEICR